MQRSHLQQAPPVLGCSCLWRERRSRCRQRDQLSEVTPRKPPRECRLRARHETFSQRLQIFHCFRAPEQGISLGSKNPIPLFVEGGLHLRLLMRLVLIFASLKSSAGATTLCPGELSSTTRCCIYCCRWTVCNGVLSMGSSILRLCLCTERCDEVKAVPFLLSDDSTHDGR